MTQHYDDIDSYVERWFNSYEMPPLVEYEPEPVPWPVQACELLAALLKRANRTLREVGYRWGRGV